MKKLLLLLCALLSLGSGSVWAALSSSTIAKSGSVTDTWNITSALPTDNWTAMGEGTPAGVTALGSYTAYSRTQDITLSNEGALSITFLYSTGNDRLEILGVDLLNGSDEVVRSDYHFGFTGTALSHNVYMLDHIASGNYKIRFIINSGVSSSVGSITVKHINIKTASSYANITQWYSVRMHSNQTNYMYYNSGASTNIAFSGTKNNEDKYLWGFVKDTDGVKIYNKAAGSSVAIDNSNPCTLSASGTSLTFTFDTGSTGSNGNAAGAYFSLYKNPEMSATSRSYLNYRVNGTIQRWDGNDEGSTWMIEEAPIVCGKLYTIKAYFSSYTDLYFTNNDGTLAFNSTASNGVKDYWILTSSGDATYPWKFESGRGDGKFLSPQDGVSTTGGYVQINDCSVNATYYHLYGGINDAADGNKRNLATWSPEGTPSKSGFAQTGDGGCYGSGHNNTNWSTDYAIEEVTGVDIYSVVSNLDDGGVTYTPSYTGVAGQTNGGFYILASAPSASDFTAKTIDNYTAGDVVVDASAKTITVNYTANLTYTLTDMNGATYEWSASGTFGTAPTLTGCDGYTLSNEVWNEGSRTYSADITFPFPVTSNSVTNYTYIGSFHNKNTFSSENFLWHSNSTNIIVHSGDAPNNTYSAGVYTENEKFKWSISPSFSNGAFTFTIKNASTGTYIYSTATSNGHNGAVSLNATATPVTYKNTTTTSTCSPIHAFYFTSTLMYLSVNSVSGDANSQLGVYSSVHDGISVGFYTPADFAALESTLSSNITIAASYSFGSELGEYNRANADVINAALEELKGAATYTAAQLNSYITLLDNSTFTINEPTTNKFYRFNIGDKYMCNVAEENVRTTTESNDDASTIFYLAQDEEYNYLVAYADGYGFNYGYCKAVSPGIFNSFTFPESATIGKYLIYSNKGTETNSYSNRYINVNGSSLEEGQGAWTITEVTSLPVTISAAGIATLHSPVALTIPDGVTAYYGSNKHDNYLTLTEIETTIPANTGVVLMADEGSYDFDIAEDVSAIEGNLITGTVSAISWTDEYTLQLDESTDEPGFFGNTPNDGVIPGFKAYMSSSNAAGVKGFTFNFATAVKALKMAQKAAGNTYDLGGRRIQKPVKGLYIVDGKKVFVN